MSKSKLKASSKKFLYLLKISIISFVAMGILIGYHGAAIVNSIIGMVWFVFATTSAMVLMAAVKAEEEIPFGKVHDELSTESFSSI